MGRDSTDEPQHPVLVADHNKVARRSTQSSLHGPNDVATLAYRLAGSTRSVFVEHPDTWLSLSGQSHLLEVLQPAYLQ